jgi:hypothetical protein
MMASGYDPSFDNRPESIADCFINDHQDEDEDLVLDLVQYGEYLQRLIDEEDYEDEVDGRVHDDRPKRSRRYKKFPRSKILENGVWRQFLPKESTFYERYLDTPNMECPVFLKEFRSRFRVPYNCFLHILEWLKESDKFSQWTRPDCTGSPCSPIGLLLLGTLRILGRDGTSDCVAELTNVSKETHRKFFHTFVHYGSTELYNKFVVTSKTKEDFE